MVTDQRLARRQVADIVQGVDIVQGAEPIGTDRLGRIARILNVDPAVFTTRTGEDRWTEEPDPARVAAFLETREGQTLISRFMQIADPTIRSRLLSLILSICACPMKPMDEKKSNTTAL